MAITERRREALRRVISRTCERLLAANNARFFPSRFEDPVQAALHQDQEMVIVAEAHRQLRELDAIPEYRPPKPHPDDLQDAELDEWILVVFASPSTLLGVQALPPEMRMAWLITNEIVQFALARQGDHVANRVRQLARLLELEETGRSGKSVQSKAKPKLDIPTPDTAQRNAQNVMRRLGINPPTPWKKPKPR